MHGSYCSFPGWGVGSLDHVDWRWLGADHTGKVFRADFEAQLVQQEEVVADT